MGKWKFTDWGITRPYSERVIEAPSYEQALEKALTSLGYEVEPVDEEN